MVPSLSVPVGITILENRLSSTGPVSIFTGYEMDKRERLSRGVAFKKLNDLYHSIRQLGRVKCAGGAWRLARVFQCGKSHQITC